MSEKLIKALLSERKGLEARGLKDRIKAVDEQLKALGYAEKSAPIEVATIEPDVEVAAAPKARRRKAV